MSDFGEVSVRTSHNHYAKCKLLEFTTIPLPTKDGHIVVVYGVLENLETGAFLARQLSEIKRD